MKTVLESLMVEGGKVLVSSIDVARFFDKQHKDVLEKIRAEIALDEQVGTERNFTPSEYKDSTGRKLPCYLMNRDGFLILVLGFTGEKAGILRRIFIQAFNEMETKLKTLISNPPIVMLGYEEARMLSIATRVDFQKAIHDAVMGANYAVITDAEYLAIYDKVKWQICHQLGVPPKANLREYLDESSLRMLDYFETQITNALRLSKGRISMAEFLKLINIIGESCKNTFTALGLPTTFGRVSDAERKARLSAKNKERRLAKKEKQAQLETKHGVKLLY